MTEFIINCSWQICNSKALKDAVHLVQIDLTQNELKFDLVDEITAERCLNLEKDINDTSNLEISFSPPNNFEITEICIICEARHIELYTHRDEYVSTSTSDVIDADVDGFAAYKNEIALVTSLTSCKLKFVSLKQPDSMWLYGIAFHIRKISCGERALPDNNISSIVSKLQEDGLKMSDGAKKLAELLKTNTSSTNNAPAYLSVFMGMINNSKFSTMNCMKNLEIKDNDSKSLEDAKENCPINQKSASLRSDSSSSMKHLVDSAIEQIEDRLWEKIKNHMEMQEERYMKKLDQILACLNK